MDGMVSMTVEISISPEGVLVSIHHAFNPGSETHPL
jgi:hypothetical protein